MEPRITLVTLGVSDLKKSFKFYREVMGFPSKDGITGDAAFFQLNHVLLSLYPKDLLAKDGNVPNSPNAFAGITLAHNVKTQEEVRTIIAHVKKAGVVVTKEAQKTEWGGYHGYFQDPDGYLWEIAWNPHFWIE